MKVEEVNRQLKHKQISNLDKKATSTLFKYVCNYRTKQILQSSQLTIKKTNTIIYPSTTRLSCCIYNRRHKFVDCGEAASFLCISLSATFHKFTQVFPHNAFLCIANSDLNTELIITGQNQIKWNVRLNWSLTCRLS